MCLQELALGCQRAVDEGLGRQQRVEHRYQRALMVVPSEAELLIIIHDWAGWMPLKLLGFFLQTIAFGRRCQTENLIC